MNTASLPSANTEQDQTIDEAKNYLLENVFGPLGTLMHRVKKELVITRDQALAILSIAHDEFAATIQEVGYFSARMADHQFALFIAEEATRSRANQEILTPVQATVE